MEHSGPNAQNRTKGDRYWLNRPNWTEIDLIEPNRNCLIFKEKNLPSTNIWENIYILYYKIIIYSHTHRFTTSYYKTKPQTIKKKKLQLVIIKPNHKLLKKKNQATNSY